MQYEIRYTPEANVGLAKLEKSEPKAFQKALRFIAELKKLTMINKMDYCTPQ